MIEAAEVEVQRRFPSVDAGHIEETVRSSVRGWCARARVTNFVPIFAAREARAVIEREQRSPNGIREARAS